MDFVLYSRITEKDGIAIADDLGITGGKELPSSRIRTLIRYGNSYSHATYRPSVVVNRREAIARTVDKQEATRIFTEHGLSVPEFSEVPPCVGRGRHHTQGQSFWLCWERSQIRTSKEEGADYFIKYIPIKQEWRVHVIEGIAKFVQRKYEQTRVSTSFMGIQGFRDDWHKQVLEPETVNRQIRELAIEATRALGLDFGAADIVISLENDRPYILEVNSGPALPITTVRLPYLRYFRSKMRGD